MPNITLTLTEDEFHNILEALNQTGQNYLSLADDNEAASIFALIAELERRADAE